MSRGDNFANFMTSTAGGTQGSSSYSGPPSGGGSGGNQNNQTQQEIIQQAQQNFQNQQQIQQDFEQQQQQNKDKGVVTEADKELEKRKEKKKFNIGEEIKSFVQNYIKMGGVMGAFGQAAMLPFRMIAEPTVETFQNPQSLAVLKLLFDSKPPEFKEQYLKDHGDILSEAYADDPTKDVRGLSDSDFFDEQLQEGAFASEQGILGAGSQRINFPAEFYTGENSASPYGAGVMPQTSGDLANLAGLDVNQFKSGPGYNQEMVDKIFAARMELDRMGKNPMTGESQGSPNQGGGGGTYVPPTTTPDDPMIPQDPTLPPGVTPPTTTPKYPGSVVTDYTQLGLPQIYGNQQMPNYATFNRQGSMPVGLQDYLDNLRKRFGIG